MSDIPEEAVKAAAEVLTHRDWKRRAPWDEGYTLSRHTDSPEEEERQVAERIAYELGEARSALTAAMPHILMDVAHKLEEAQDQARSRWDKDVELPIEKRMYLMGLDMAAQIVEELGND